jgi:hypothetical protein
VINTSREPSASGITAVTAFCSTNRPPDSSVRLQSNRISNTEAFFPLSIYPHAQLRHSIFRAAAVGLSLQFIYRVSHLRRPLRMDCLILSKPSDWGCLWSFRLP